MPKKINDTFDEAWLALRRLGLDYRQAYRAWQIITGHLDKDGWFRVRPGKPSHHIPHRLLDYGDGRPADDDLCLIAPCGTGSMYSEGELERLGDELANESWYRGNEDDERDEDWWRRKREEPEQRGRRRTEGQKDHISTTELIGAEAKRQREGNRVEKLHPTRPARTLQEDLPEGQRAAIKRKKRGGQW